MAEAKKLDPSNIEGIEKSLNDSATRVSTIWISFLIFSLYLLITSTTVEHRQLLLAEPVKLPVLNIDLPLWGFFFLAPILFVTFHAYVLLQVLLLARTAAAYNETLDQAVLSPRSNTRMRQRLANTLFAQIFAGSPRERDGWLGRLLRAMAWITLVIAPILILLAFQFAFLPYHSHVATWMHRILILAELAGMFLLWPLVVDPHRDFDWSKLIHELRRQGLFLTSLALLLLWPLVIRKPRRVAPVKRHQRSRYRRFGQRIFPMITCLMFVLTSLWLATFPGEPHVNLLTGQSISSVQCTRWFHQDFDYVDLRFDRLDLPRVDVVDDEKLAKIAQATASRKLRAYQGERTRNFRGRDLNCGNFSSADLRRVDLAGARLSGASLISTALEGAVLDGADLRDASLDAAQLQDASFKAAQLQGAVLIAASLQGAFLDEAKLQGAYLSEAALQGASLSDAKLQGATLDGAQLQGSWLYGVQFQGASLVRAQLQGASFYRAALEAASLSAAEMQGADFTETSMTYVDFSGTYVWRSKGLDCRAVNVRGHKPDAVVGGAFEMGGEIRAIPDEVTKFIERSVAEIPDTSVREQAANRMRHSLSLEVVKDDDTAEIAKVWRDCEELTNGKSDDEFQDGRARLLRKLVCDAKDDREAIILGTVRNWFRDGEVPRYFTGLLAHHLLANDGRDCPAMKYLWTSTKERLRAAMVPAAIVPKAAAPLLPLAGFQ